ncbi:MAG: ATP-binding domain-containing protein, partial [Candidatus Eisenbacteria bacterium]|nr:ATP-binding domain-containing protein [Candidatus Eisenbacteria bacterium]
SGGISFRGFLDRLLEDAEAGRSPEAPILEDGSDGVRIMTVHKAKGLEFPVVILADPTDMLAKGASRVLDPARGLCAMKLGGWAPSLLREYEEVERARDESEGVRLAYVAATRARDLLVVPTLAEGEHALFTASEKGLGATGWIGPVSESLYPTREAWARVQIAPGCPPPLGPAAAGPAAGATPSADLSRTDSGGDRVDTGDDGADFDPPTGVPGYEIGGGVRPGWHRIEYEDDAGEPLATVDAVWWDLSLLDLKVRSLAGLRREDLVAKGDPAAEAQGAERYRAWTDARDRRLAAGEHARHRLVTATRWSEEHETIEQEPSSPISADELDVEVVALEGAGSSRPSGPRFGALVHAVLESVPLRASALEIERATRLQARILGATDAERTAAGGLVSRALEHPLLRRAAVAEEQGRCHRETPVLLHLEADGERGATYVDGVVDLAFLEGDRWIVVDYKTDRELTRALAVYRRQIALYVRAIRIATGVPVHGILFRL